MRKYFKCVLGECEDCACRTCIRQNTTCPEWGGCANGCTDVNDNFREVCEYKLLGSQDEQVIVERFCSRLRVLGILETFQVPTDILLNELEKLSDRDRHIVERHILSLTRR